MRNQWFLFACGLLVCTATWFLGFQRVKSGSIVQIPITLITSDFYDLSCAWSGSVDGYRCGYRAPDTLWEPPVPPAQRLAPYKDTRNTLFLIAGLFEQPAVQQRLQSESPENRPREALQRFTAVCQLKLLEKRDDFKVRWVRDADWGPGELAWLAEAVQCSVE